MWVVQRLRNVDWTDPDVKKGAQRAMPVSAGVFALTGSVIGTASGVGGAVGAGFGGGIGALLGYAYAGLNASSMKSRSA